MGALRQRKNQQLPRHVYRDKGYNFYWPYLGKVNGKYKRGNKVRLCKESEPLSVLWEQFNNQSPTGRLTINLRWLFTQYEQSKDFKKLSLRKQNERKQNKTTDWNLTVVW